MKQVVHLEKKLKTLKLGGILHTLEERLRQAQAEGWSHIDFTERILEDEIERREAKKLDQRLVRANFEEYKTMEEFDFAFNPTIPARQLRELATCLFIDRHEHVILEGQVGVGKTHLGEAIGHAACRKGFSTLFVKAQRLLANLMGGRADGTREKRLRTYLAPDLLIIDDFALRKLTVDQADDFYDIVTERHLTGSMIVTSNRSIQEWVDMFPDPVLGNSAMDRLAHNAHQISIKGPSYRKTSGPGGRSRPAEPEGGGTEGVN